MALETSNRLFERRSQWNQAGGKHHTHYVAKCHRCSGEDTININRHTNTLPIDLIAKAFQNKGWIVGRTRSHDLCPKCIEAEAREARRRSEERMEARRQAEINLVLAKANQPDPVPVKITKEVIAQHNRDVATFADRIQELRKEAVFISATTLTLVDQAAEIEAEIAELVAAITNTTSINPDLLKAPSLVTADDEKPVFERVSHSGRQRIAGRTVRFNYYPNSEQSVIVISAELATILGYTRGGGDRVFIGVGTGKHKGLLHIERTREPNHSLSVFFDPSDHVRLTTGQIVPANPKVTINAACQFQIDSDNNLIVSLPPEFFDDEERVAAIAENVTAAAA